MADETRDRIITATTELFRRQGYNGTSLKQVTTAAQAPVGSLYHHFPGGKSELARVVLETSGAIFRTLFEMIWDDSESPSDAVSAFFSGAADVLESTDFIDPCPIGGVAREVANTDEELRVAANAVFDSWIESARKRLIAHDLGDSIARDLATTLVSSIEGGFLLARASRNADQLRRTGHQMALLVRTSIAEAQRTIS